MSAKARIRKIRDRQAEPGHVVWHCSEPGGGPDVGMTLGLGGGNFLWVGEITNSTYQEWLEPGTLGGGCGWWLVRYPEGEPIARFTDALAARLFVDTLEASLLALLRPKAARRRPNAAGAASQGADAPAGI